METENRNSRRFTMQSICAALIISACLLMSGLTALGQEAKEQKTRENDHTYGEGGRKTTTTTTGKDKDSDTGTELSTKKERIYDGNGVLRESHTTVTYEVVFGRTSIKTQTDEYFDCKGNLVTRRFISYNKDGKELSRQEEQYKDGKLVSGSESGIGPDLKKFNHRYNPNTGKWEGVAFDVEPSSNEISAPRDTSVCPINTYANQLVGGFNIIREDSKPDNFNTYGFDFSFTHNFERDNTKNSAISHRVGLTADFDMNFRNLNGVDLTKTSVLGGVTILPFNGAMSTDKVTFSTHALFGVAHLTSSFGSVSTSDNSFTMKLGGAVDVNVNQRFFIRPIQIDYAPTFFGNTTQNNVQFTFGAGIRFGHTGSSTANVPKGP